MVTGKAVAEVTDAEVKNLEKYLIIISSIAAALASTLIAITAVRIVRPTTAQPVPTILMKLLPIFWSLDWCFEERGERGRYGCANNQSDAGRSPKPPKLDRNESHTNRPKPPARECYPTFGCCR
jgi:hypothetical protein